MHHQMDLIAVWAPWLIPIVALAGLWLGRCSTDQQIRTWAERAFYSLLLVVGGGTMRTLACDDTCWLLHTSSLSIMIVGAVLPAGSSPQVEGW